MSSHKLKKSTDRTDNNYGMDSDSPVNKNSPVKHGAEIQLQSINACVAQLLLLEPPDAIRKELAAFVVSARKILAGSADQTSVVLEYSQLQGKVLEPFIHNAREGLVSEGQGAIETLFSSESLERLPPYSSVAQAIETILSNMLIGISVPEEAIVAFNKARQLLDAGLNWYELAALLEQVAVIMDAALRDDQREMQSFLQVLDGRLKAVNNEVSQLNTVAHSLFSNDEHKDAYFRKNIHDMTESAMHADSLQELKSSVLDGLDSMQGRFDQLRDERCVTQEQYEARIGILQARIHALESLHNDEGERMRANRNGNQKDGLTGLPNRASCDNKIEFEMARWESSQQKFCLVMTDIDHFGLINDQYGGLAADKVLSVIAKTIRQQLRRIDFIARYSGNTLAIVLPDTDTEKALSLMNELGVKIRSTPFRYNQEPLKMTVSFGIAQVAGKGGTHALLDRANKALYHAKSSGHDRAVVSPIVL